MPYVCGLYSLWEDLSMYLTHRKTYVSVFLRITMGLWNVIPFLGVLFWIYNCLFTSFLIIGKLNESQEQQKKFLVASNFINLSSCLQTSSKSINLTTSQCNNNIWSLPIAIIDIMIDSFRCSFMFSTLQIQLEPKN